MPTPVEQYLIDKKIDFKPMGDNQFNLHVCPACKDNKWTHCYINRDNGCWHCFKCDAKGSFNTFRNFFGDSPFDLGPYLATHPVASREEKIYNKPDSTQVTDSMARLITIKKDHLAYLKTRRGLTPETIEFFRLGVSQEEKITIPIYENGQLVNIRYRRNPAEDALDSAGAKYTQERGCKQAFFNGDIIETESITELFITEGEFDAMMLWQNGYKNVVSITIGAGSFPDEWVKRLASIKTIYLCYDPDEDGQAGAMKAAKKLGYERCKNIVLPLVSGRKKTDVTNFFVDDKHSTSDFKALVDKAVSFTEKEIIHISDLVDPLRDALLSGDTYGIGTGFTAFDGILGGLRKGRMIVLSGLTSVGKSSFAACMALNVAVDKKPVFIFSLEMPPIDLAKKFLQLHGKIEGNMLKSVTDPSPVLTKIDQTLVSFKGPDALPIYFYNGSGMIKMDILESVIKTARDKHGVKLVVIDHLHYFAHNFSNATQETAMIARSIKQIAVRLEVPILLLAHLNRGGRTNQRKGLYMPNLSDLKDTSSIEQDADQVIFVCRDSENEKKEEREKSIIKIAKNRDGAAGRSVSMHFSEDITYFEEVVGVNYEDENKAKVAEQTATLEPQQVNRPMDIPF